jgi:GDP/GTP exchange factor required for growth at low temperature
VRSLLLPLRSLLELTFFSLLGAGIFLRDLALNAELPTFLDPTSPSHAASVSTSGCLLSPVDPSAFSSLPPLPPSIPLAPLINVHKFRVLSSTVNRVVAFQRLAQQYEFEPVPQMYLKCLRLRCLEQEVMAELSKRLE